MIGQRKMLIFYTCPQIICPFHNSVLSSPLRLSHNKPIKIKLPLQKLFVFGKVDILAYYFNLLNKQYNDEIDSNKSCFLLLPLPDIFFLCHEKRVPRYAG